MHKKQQNYLIVECPECNTAFRKQDVCEDSDDVFCECKNLSVGPKNVENSRYKFYVAVTYSKTRPRIYELKEANKE